MSRASVVRMCLLLVPVPRVYLKVLRFSSYHKNQQLLFQFDLQTVDERPFRGRHVPLQIPTYIFCKCNLTYFFCHSFRFGAVQCSSSRTDRKLSLA